MEEPKKVLFLITKATWGGAQKYVSDLATHLPADYRPQLAYGIKGKLAEDLGRAHIVTHEVSALGRDIAILSDIRSFFEIWALLRKERPEVLHVNSSKAAALGALAGRLSGVPRIVFTAHGWPFKEQRGFVSKTLIHWISWLTTILSHATIVVSREDEVLGKNMWGVGKKIHFVALSLDATDMLPRHEAEQILYKGHAERFLNEKMVRLVTIAELTKNKGVSYGIEMMVELKKRRPRMYSYVIIGDGEERINLERLAQEMEVADSLTFLNVASDISTDLATNAAKYLEAFDVYVLPSIKEGMPYVLLEAAAAGLPIVATTVVKQEVAELPNIMFVAPKSGIELADAVEQIVQNVHTHSPVILGSFSKMLTNTVALY